MEQGFSFVQCLPLIALADTRRNRQSEVHILVETRRGPWRAQDTPFLTQVTGLTDRIAFAIGLSPGELCFIEGEGC